MPDFPRDLPHLYLRGSGRPEPYTSKTPPPRHRLPQRERNAHAAAIEAALVTALAGAQARRAERDPELLGAEAGFYLDFDVVENPWHDRCLICSAGRWAVMERKLLKLQHLLLCCGLMVRPLTAERPRKHHSDLPGLYCEAKALDGHYFMLFSEGRFEPQYLFV